MEEFDQLEHRSLKEKMKEGALLAMSATVNGAKNAIDKTREVSSGIYEKAKEKITSKKLYNAAQGTSSLLYGGISMSKDSFSNFLEKAGIKNKSPEEEAFLRFEKNAKTSYYVPPSGLNSSYP